MPLTVNYQKCFCSIYYYWSWVSIFLSKYIHVIAWPILTTGGYITEFPSLMWKVRVNIAPWWFLLGTRVAAVVFWVLQLAVHRWCPLVVLWYSNWPTLTWFTRLGDVHCAVVPAPSIHVAFRWKKCNYVKLFSTCFVQFSFPIIQ